MSDFKPGMVIKQRIPRFFSEADTHVFIKYVGEEEILAHFNEDGFSPYGFVPSTLRIGFIKAWRAKNDKCGLAEAKRVMDNVFADSDNWGLEPSHWPVELKLIVANKEISIVTMLNGSHVLIVASLEYKAVEQLTREELLVHPCHTLRIIAQNDSQS